MIGKAAKRVLLVLALVWFALGVNAWRYFSDSGLLGIYYSAVHAIDIVRLPERLVITAVPDGLQRLRDDEVGLLVSGMIRDRMLGRKAAFIIRSRQTELAEKPNLVVSYVFTGPNTYTSGSNHGVVYGSWVGRFILDNDRICNLPKGRFPGACYPFFKNEKGDLFRYRPARRSVSAEWLKIEIDKGE